MITETKPLSEQLRESVLFCGRSLYRLSMDSGISVPQLSRFANGKAWLGQETMDKLADCLGLVVTSIGEKQ